MDVAINSVELRDEYSDQLLNQAPAEYPSREVHLIILRSRVFW